MSGYKRKWFGLVLLIALFVSCKPTKLDKIKVEKLAETSKSWNGDALPKYPEGKPKITALRITIPPKTKLHNHYHRVINSGILMKGELKVVDEEGHVLILKEGDVIIELVNKIHYGVNEGKKPAEIVVFYSGTEDLPITVVEKE